ncbi:hypothetical protein [Sphingobium yanoikuyae]|nr:hypothetical protein [Sphingobium yanoikuyae]
MPRSERSIAILAQEEAGAKVVAEFDGDVFRPRPPRNRNTQMNQSRYVRVRKFAEISGYTEKAIYRKIEDGVWLAGKEFRRAPDGNICIDIEGYEKWVEAGRAAASRR